MNTISQIKICIKDEYDEKIAFVYSSFTLKLHFIPQKFSFNSLEITQKLLLINHSKMSFQHKSRLMHENIELSPDSFCVTFSTPTAKNKENESTNFTHSLARSKGDYELTLSSLGLS
jgi:hypothetical protein